MHDFYRIYALTSNAKTGTCNYAKYQLSSARIGGGNVSIEMIRKRARGIRDTEYFKLKITAILNLGFLIFLVLEFLVLAA